MRNKKRLFYIIAIVAVLSILNLRDKPKDAVNSSKEKVESTVVEAEKSKSKIKASYISDEEAKKIAAKAVKDYLNSDADNFTQTHITRRDSSRNTKIEVEGEKYVVSKDRAKWIQDKLDENNIKAAKQELEWALEERPNVINVIFSSPSLDKAKFTANSVDIDADTKEILSIFSHSDLKEYKGEPDSDKIQESVINFFKRIDKEVEEESVLEECDIDYDFGRAMINIKLTSGSKVSIVMDLKDYEVVTYAVDYLNN